MTRIARHRSLSPCTDDRVINRWGAGFPGIELIEMSTRISTSSSAERVADT
jgi:hypothetical protein